MNPCNSMASMPSMNGDCGGVFPMGFGNGVVLGGEFGVGCGVGGGGGAAGGGPPDGGMMNNESCFRAGGPGTMKDLAISTFGGGGNLMGSGGGRIHMGGGGSQSTCDDLLHMMGTSSLPMGPLMGGAGDPMNSGHICPMQGQHMGPCPGPACFGMFDQYPEVVFDENGMPENTGVYYGGAMEFCPMGGEQSWDGVEHMLPRGGEQSWDGVVVPPPPPPEVVGRGPPTREVVAWPREFQKII